MTTLYGVNGTVCTAEQYQLSIPSADNPVPLISCLTHGESIGLTLSVETSLLSLISVIGIYIWIATNRRWYKRNVHSDWELFGGAADVYMFSLLAFDIMQAIGGILNIRWAHDGIVSTGPYCTTQGIIEQFGELGVAVTTLILAVHTFVVLMWHQGSTARGFALGLVILVVIFSALWVGIGAGIHKHYETPTPFWCWISPQYPGERLGGEYIWLWLALFASLLYIPSFFSAGGRLSVDGEKWYSLRFHGVVDEQKRAALGLVLYPVAYSLVVLPLSIARWSLFDHKNVPSAATFFGICMFYLSGAVNALLLVIARPKLLLLSRPDVDGQAGAEPVRVVVQDADYNPEPVAMVPTDGGSSTALSRKESV